MRAPGGLQPPGRAGGGVVGGLGASLAPSPASAPPCSPRMPEPGLSPSVSPDPLQPPQWVPIAGAVQSQNGGGSPSTPRQPGGPQHPAWDHAHTWTRMHGNTRAREHAHTEEHTHIPAGRLLQGRRGRPPAEPRVCAPTLRRDGENCRTQPLASQGHTGVQACVQWGRPDPPLCGQRRWQRELSSLSPSDCLLRHESHTIPVPRFPHWSSWPQAISQERNQTAPGAPSACSAPGWGPRAPAALRIQPMRSVLHACPRTRHTC